MLWTWLGLCLGRARPEQRGSRSPSSRGCRGVSVSHTSISGILVSVCPWECAPLEIWELHPGGPAFPVAVPVLSHGDLLFSTWTCTFPPLFWLKPRNVVPSVVCHPLSICSANPEFSVNAEYCLFRMVCVIGLHQRSNPPVLFVEKTKE